MKIGLLSDIHADLAGLRGALAIFQAHNVQQILCAGDLVEGGPEGDAVVDTIKQLEIPCVQGNHDREAFADQAYLRRIQADLNSPGIQAVYLQSATVGFLAGLPLSRRLFLGGVEIVLAHGVPWSNTTYLFPDASSEGWDELVDKTSTDIIVLGHTHVPMCKQVRDTWVVNPGSVYQNRWKENQTCAILETEPFSFTLYDITTQQAQDLAHYQMHLLLDNE